jgi:ribosomal protein S18 acetylase RimI-like enzyme
VALTGFLNLDPQGVQPEPLPPREVLEGAMLQFAAVPGFLRYEAWVGPELAGIASLRLDDGVAQLCGAATLPAFRRRGVQSALLGWRLGEAFRAGCELAVMTTQPGSRSQQNGQRQGFALLYARALLVKPPA